MWTLGTCNNHRLNGSSSPVLTATCLSYGSLCDFLTFFPNRPGGHTPRPILRQNGSNDVDSRAHVPFGVKIATFCNPDPQTRKTAKICPILVGTKFSLDFAFNIGGLTSKHPLIFIGDKSVIVNRQCGGGKFKYVPKFCIGVQVTWYRACAMTICIGQAL